MLGRGRSGWVTSRVARFASSYTARDRTTRSRREATARTAEPLRHAVALRKRHERAPPALHHPTLGAGLARSCSSWPAPRRLLHAPIARCARWTAARWHIRLRSSGGGRLRPRITGLNVHSMSCMVRDMATDPATRVALTRSELLHLHSFAESVDDPDHDAWWDALVNKLGRAISRLDRIEHRPRVTQRLSHVQADQRPARCRACGWTGTLTKTSPCPQCGAKCSPYLFYSHKEP